MNPTQIADFARTLMPGEESKDRLIDILQAQLAEAREELRSTQHELSITDAKLEESRRALDRCMGFRL